MVFELLWMLIGILCLLGYLYLWIQQRIESSRTKFPETKNDDELKPVGLMSISNIQGPDLLFEEEPETTNLDEDDDKNPDKELYHSKSPGLTDLDDIDGNNMMDKPDKFNINYERSFDAPIEDEEFDFLSSDDELSFLKLNKANSKGKYYAICTIKSDHNPDFVKTDEGTLITIDDFDNVDYWLTAFQVADSGNIAVVPKCCISTTPDGIMVMLDQSRKRNTREIFREDILKISNKVQESTMKRKYALADMIECDREYCATLKLIKEILASMDNPVNKFGDKIESLFRDILGEISRIHELHENEILPKLSTCVMNPVSVANVILEQKSKFYQYPHLQIQWSIIKSELDHSKIKNIFLENLTTSEKSKFSISSFKDLMRKVEEKISQYVAFLFDIMKYTGRINGDVYLLQKAITMFNRIKRHNKEKPILMKLLEGTDIEINNERIIRMTESVMISETEVMKRNRKNLQLYNEEVCSLFLLNNYVICLNNSIDLKRTKILDLKHTKIYSKENYENSNEIILWSKLDKQNYRIFIFFFPTKFSKLGWIYDVKKRLGSKGANDVFVSSADFNKQYQNYLDKYQRLAAIEMESISLESATLDIDRSSIYDQLEDVTMMSESNTDIKFESAITDVPSSVTSGSYKTAPETLKSGTDKAIRPISIISEDSISTLDGVRTPFSDEESTKYVSIISDIDEINVPEGEALVWTVKLINFEILHYDVLWAFSGKIIDFNKPDSSILITEKNNKIHECTLTKENITKLESGQLTCKIVDKINCSLIASKSINVFVPVSYTVLDLTFECSEITVMENESIVFKLNGVKDSLKSSVLKHVIWYKDNEKLNMNDSRIQCYIDQNNSQIVLNIGKASTSDAGIYTIGQDDSGHVLIKQSENISLLLLVERCKKKIFKTANQENQSTLEESHVQSISPLKELANLTKFDNDFDIDDMYKRALTSITPITESSHMVISAMEKNIEVLDQNKVILKVLISAPLKMPPTWFFNNTDIKSSDNIKMIYDKKDKYSEFIINHCNKEHTGVYKCAIINPFKNAEEFVEISVKVITKEISGFLDCEIEEMDLKCGETLAIKLKSKGIPLPTLKNGSWHLNSEKMDITSLNGNANIFEDEVNICVPHVTRPIAGILQYRIDQPVKLYSPEIKIKIRGSLKKIEETKPVIKDPKDPKPDTKDLKESKVQSSGFLDCEIEEMDLKCGETLAIKLKSTGISLSTLNIGSWYLNSEKIDITKLNGNANNFENEINICVPQVTKDIAGILQFRIDKPVKLYSPEIKIKIRESQQKIEEKKPDIKDPKDLKSGIKDSKPDIKDPKDPKSNIKDPKDSKPDIKDKKECQVQSSGFLDCEIEEMDLKCGETLAIKLKSTGISLSTLNSGSWYLNSEKLDITKLNGNSNNFENEINICVPQVTKDIAGTLQFRIDKPVKLYSPEIKIKIRGSQQKTEENKPDIKGPKSDVKDTKDQKDSKTDSKDPKESKVQSSGFLDCEIEEMDLKCGETLAIKLKSTGISLSTLNSGSWYLNSEKIDITKLNGNANNFENEINICVPQVTKDIAGILQYRIDKPVKLYSPEIKIKIRGSQQKTEEKKPDIKGPKSDMKDTKDPKDSKPNINDKKDSITDSKDPKESKIQSSGFLDCEIEEMDLKCGETLAIKLKSTGISLSTLNSGSWYLNSDKLDITKLNGNANNFENEINICVPKVTKDIGGILQYRIDEPVKLYSPEIKIKIRGSQQKIEENKPDIKNLKKSKVQSSGFLDCEIEEMDLKCGETLAIKLKSIGIPLSTLNNGCWYLNSEKLDVKKLNGKANNLENEINICVPQVTKDIAGNLQFRIDKPVKLYSPEIKIKIREDLSKSNKEDLSLNESIILLELSNIFLDLRENDEIILEAKVVSGNISLYQEPQWYLNDSDVSNVNCKKYFQNGIAHLEISYSKPADAGQYKVIFQPCDTNSLSKVVGVFTVSIKSIKRNLKAIDSNIKVFISEAVTLCVDVEGFIEKEIKWKLPDHYPEKETSDRVIQKFSNNLAFLLIDSVVLEDTGIYFCQGFVNRELISECQIELLVIDKTNENVLCKVGFEKEIYFVELNERIVMRARLECSSSHYSVSWFFNCRSLEMKSDMMSDIKEDGKLAELTINNCNSSFNGVYECVIESKDGHTSKAKTELKVIEKSCYYLKCKDTHIDIDEGDEMKLEISIEKPCDVKVKWSKNNVDISIYPDFNVVATNNQFLLSKNNASVTDSGKYRCEACIDSDLEEFVDFIVTVHPKNDSVDGSNRLRLHCEDSEITVKKSEPLIISLEVFNWNTATVEWFKNNKKFGDSYELDNQFVDLYIENPSPMEHRGKYVCRVTNENGETENKEIIVKFLNDIQTIPEENDLLLCTVEEVDIEEGEKLELSVESKIPTESVTSTLWYKDNNPVDEKDSRLTAIVQVFCYNLILLDVNLSDAGIYSLRNSDKSVDITVKVRPKLTKTQTEDIFKTLKAPQIKKPLQDILINKEPETVKFEFEVEECGPTKSIWYFEDEEIEVENAEFIQWYYDNFFALTIPVAGEKHCGRYTIQVANEMGVVKSDARLSLMLKSKAPEMLNESCCIAPMFTKRLKDLDILPKENIRLSCRIMSDPKPKILWTKDGETLDPQNLNKRIKISNELPNLHLTVSDSEPNDAGRYCCLATNYLGYDTTEAVVIINDDEENGIASLNDSDLIMVKPLSSPILTADFPINGEVILSWTSVQTKDLLDISYSIEKQKSLTSTNWKKIMKNLTSTTCTLSFLYLPPNEQHTIRCVATSEYGFETISNIISIPIRANAPILPSDKPLIVFKDASCVKISWSRGRCKDLTTEESIGKVSYSLEMKDNPKSSWQIVSNELTNNEYLMALEPGVSFMFRVTAFNEYGMSEPTQSLISRIDRLKLVPDFSIEPPWLHMKGQPCLKWRSATVPEYCESCVTGIAPDYKVEYRNGRLSPWKVYQENIAQNEVYLTANIIEAAQEFRVSCRNKFGQNGPTRSYRLQSNLVGKSSQRSPSREKSQNIIKYDQLKNAEIISIFNDGLSLKWEPWLPDQINKYVIQKKNLYTTEWDSVQSIIFGEDCFLELPLSENMSRRLRILALDETKHELHNGYNNILIPNKDECVPSIPENLEITDISNTHTINWTPSKCLQLIDSPIVYSVQWKTSTQLWLTIADKLDKCFFKNTKIDKCGINGYRISAKNSIGSSGFSKEVFIQSMINVLANEQIVKSIRYFVNNPDEIEIKWQLCESIFDNGLTTEDLTFQIEKKLVKETIADWVSISDRVAKNSIMISMMFEDENLFRIQPFYKEDKLTPSRIFRMYISKDLLVPDMSFIRPTIISETITNYSIEWPEPELQSGFSSDGIEICIPSVLLVDLQYEVQYVMWDPSVGNKTRAKDIKNLPWIAVATNLEDNYYSWESPDPTQEYMFRIFATNQFGRGTPSQTIKLHPQISLPDFSFIRLTIEDIPIPGSNGEKETILSWTPPKMSSDLYTPYSIDVQYRPMNYSNLEEEGWSVLKTNIKKNRVNISELNPTVIYQLRIIPITDFGIGKPSMITKRARRNESQISSAADGENKIPDKQIVASEVFCCLSQNAELRFTKLVEHDMDQVNWTFNHAKINTNNGKYSIFPAESYGMYFVIKNLEENDFGQYSALNSNEELIQSFIIIKSDAPTFLNCLPNRSLNLHENLYISIHIDAQPPPDVVWRKNWKKMFSSYRTMITEDKERSMYSLTISKCILSDSGEYTVRAENAVGFSEMKFNVRVDAQPEKKSIQINEGDINDRYYIMKHLSKGSYSNCQILIEKSTQNEFIGKFFGINNIGIAKTEFECIHKIRQRNIVEIFDAVALPGQYLVLVYEKLQGIPLVTYLSTLSHWCESQVRIIIHQLIQAVTHLHGNEICHLDIKPENIMITGKYHEIVKLYGFSNAIRVEDLKTRRQRFVTSPFSAPELLKGELIDMKCDMWSIGILTFLCLHGHAKVNFEGKELYAEDTPDNISLPACDFIKKCLSMKPNERLASNDGMNHEWFLNKSSSLDASLDYLIDAIVKLMTYPEEMVPHFSIVMKNTIETFLVNYPPKLILNNSPSSTDGSLSPSISQLSSRASSVSRDGINYESFDQSSDNMVDENKSDRHETFQGVDRHFVSKTTKDMLFTVPLKDQSFKVVSVSSKNTVTLTCQLSLIGSEPISISWYKNQELLKDDSRIKLEVIKGGFLSCTISKPSDSDAGIYRCVARCHSLRTETSARLMIGDVPTEPKQLSVYYVNPKDILLTWNPYLMAIDDIIYRIDTKIIDEAGKKHTWKTVGYSVDNRYLLENLEGDIKFIARIIAQNKYGYSSYSIATSVFHTASRNIHPSKQALIYNRKWMLTTRQSKTFNDLHDLIKDISPDDIKMNVIKEYYSLLKSDKQSTMEILKLSNMDLNYPEYIVERTYKTNELYPAIDLCMRTKYYHLPIMYGDAQDPTTGYLTTFEEYVPGGNLLSVLLARSTYSEFTVVTIMRQLLETIQFLHSNNIVHANINPSNILVARRTNQLFDIKLVGLEACQFIGTVKDSVAGSYPKMSIFKAPEYRYESLTKTETDIWSLGVLTFLLLSTQLPSIEDACSESDVQCCVKNTKTLLLPMTHTHFRAPKLSLLYKFSKSARKFVHNSLKRNPTERGNADYWLANTWFNQDPQKIYEMQLQTISANHLAEFLNNDSS